MPGEPTIYPPQRPGPYYFGTRITGVAQNSLGISYIGVEELALVPFDGEIDGLFVGGCSYQIENDSDETKWLWSVSYTIPSGYCFNTSQVPPGGTVNGALQPGRDTRWYSHILTLLDYNPGLTGGPLPAAPPSPYYFVD